MSNFRALALWTLIRPRTVEAPPKYSATIAPMRLSVVATFIAVKKYGRAFGTRSLRKIVQSLAAYDRMSSTAAGSTSTRPRTTLAMTGKDTRIAAISALDNGLTRPNQLFSSGAKAMIATAFAATASGRRVHPALTQGAEAKAVRRPAVV